MPSKNNDKGRKILRIIILTVVVVVAFVVSVANNIVGMKQAINKESDSTGMVGFTARDNGKASLNNKKNNNTNKETKVDDKGKVIEKDILINAVPIISLNNNKWDRINARLSGFEIDENGNAVFDEGYTLYCNGKYVNYAVFNSNYEKEIIGHLKVGAEFETIEETLGEPSFRSESYLGYKTKEVYVFFYNDEISIYPNNNVSNESLELLFKDYIENTYEKDKTYLVIDIRNNYPDFNIESSNNGDVIWKSTTRQVVAKLSSDGNLDVELYNGYKVANSATQKYIDEKVYALNEKDLVEIMENERMSDR